MPKSNLEFDPLASLPSKDVIIEQLAKSRKQTAQYERLLRALELIETEEEEQNLQEQFDG